MNRLPMCPTNLCPPRLKIHLVVRLFVLLVNTFPLSFSCLFHTDHSVWYCLCCNSCARCRCRFTSSKEVREYNISLQRNTPSSMIDCITFSLCVYLMIIDVHACMSVCCKWHTCYPLRLSILYVITNGFITVIVSSIN
jgi:hypothetical protein